MLNVPLSLSLSLSPPLSPTHTGKGPRYSPSSSAALGADQASREDATSAVVRATELLEVSLVPRIPHTGARA